MMEPENEIRLLFNFEFRSQTSMLRFKGYDRAYCLVIILICSLRNGLGL
jgi:hypothetical protein